MLGTRDYLAKNGFTDAVVGLSGGIDSSLVATVAVDALGPDHVHGLSMPSRYSSDGSVTDAERAGREPRASTCAIVPIEPAHARPVGPARRRCSAGRAAGLTDENLQSRIRGVLLMAVSNARGWIVLTTGNKSEMATGYSTLYGDSAGGFAVIKDVPKTLVYGLCRYRNARAGRRGRSPIPEAVLTSRRRPSCGPTSATTRACRPTRCSTRCSRPTSSRTARWPSWWPTASTPAVVDRVVRLVDGAEYKRRQMPPGVRITAKAFGKDRRMPITNRYRARRADPGRPTGGPGGRWREAAEPSRPARGACTSLEAGRLVGAYRWIERRLFELPGAWARRSRARRRPSCCFDVYSRSTPGTPSSGPTAPGARPARPDRR